MKLGDGEDEKSTNDENDQVSSPQENAKNIKEGYDLVDRVLHDQLELGGGPAEKKSTDSMTEGDPASATDKRTEMSTAEDDLSNLSKNQDKLAEAKLVEDDPYV